MGAEMNPGSLNKKIAVKKPMHDLYDIVTGEENLSVYWQECPSIWAEVTEGKTGTLVPMAVKSPAIEMIIRKTEINEAYVVVLDDEIYWITSVMQGSDHPIYLKVTAVKIDHNIASIYRPLKVKTEIGATGWDVLEIGSTVCALCERYVTAKSATGHDETTTTLIMVTPKDCSLNEGDSVEVLGSRWKVTTAYLMNAYKNRYLIEKIKDN